MGAHILGSFHLCLKFIWGILMVNVTIYGIHTDPMAPWGPHGAPAVLKLTPRHSKEQRWHRQKLISPPRKTTNLPRHPLRHPGEANVKTSWGFSWGSWRVDTSKNIIKTYGDMINDNVWYNCGDMIMIIYDGQITMGIWYDMMGTD